MAHIGTFTAQFPAGQYYVGDLCYTLHPEWRELCNLMFPDNYSMQEGELTVQNKRLFLASTAYGDGCYLDNFDRQYAVYSGTLGIIAVKDIDPSELKNLVNGNVIDFNQDFTVTAEGGIFNFGDIYINTASFEDDDNDEEIDF